MHEPGEKVIAGFGALALGALAAALPTLLHEPVSDRPALRGLALATTLWMVASFLIARAAWRDASRASLSERGASSPRRSRAPLRRLLGFAMPLLLLALLALLLGVESGEVRALNALLQASWGWHSPIHFLSLGSLSLVALAALARLAGSLRVRRFQWARLLLPGLVFLALGWTVAALRLDALPAAVGSERASKGLVLVLFVALCLAALNARPAGRTDRDLRAPILAAGMALAGLVALGVALDYLAPSVSDLACVEVARDVDGWTLLDGTLRSRPDLHGTFGLAPGATRLELVGVLPVSPTMGRAATPQGTARGLAHLEVSGEELGAAGSLLRGQLPVEARVFVRSRWLPWLDRPSPLTVANPLSWSVSPGFRYAVSIAPESSPGSDVGGTGERWSDSIAWPSWRSRIELSRFSWLGSRSQVIASRLPESPRVLWIDDRAVRFLVTSDFRTPLALPAPTSNPRGNRYESSAQIQGSSDRSLAMVSMPAPRPHYLGLATYLVNERKWVDQKWSDIHVGQEIRLSPDRRYALAGCEPSRPPTVAFCVFDLEAEGKVIPSRELSARLPETERAMPLAGGAVAAIWYPSGSSPMHWSLTLFGPDGRETRTVHLGEAAGVLFSRQLEDGSLAIARRSGRTARFNAPTFGWRLEAFDPKSGDRRLLGEDLGTFPVSGDGVSRVFLERSGRLVVPTAHGLVDARTGPRSYRQTLDSTARLERDVR